MLFLFVMPSFKSTMSAMRRNKILNVFYLVDTGCIFVRYKMTFEKNRWQPKRNDQFYFLCDPEILGFDLSAINPDQNCGVLLTGIEPQHFSQDAHENRPKQWVSLRQGSELHCWYTCRTFR